MKSFEDGVKNIIGASLELGLPNKASIGSFISNAVRNLAAISLECGYKIKGLEVGTAAAAPAKEEKKKDEPKKE